MLKKAGGAREPAWPTHKPRKNTCFPAYLCIFAALPVVLSSLFVEHAKAVIMETKKSATNVQTTPVTHSIVRVAEGRAQESTTVPFATRASVQDRNVKRKLSRSQRLNYCVEENISGFDPRMDVSMVTYQVIGTTLYDRLVDIDTQNNGDFLGYVYGHVQPSLAVYWTISNDHKTYTFHLRRRVSFHDQPWFAPTRFLTADDVIFTFRQAIDPQNFFRKALNVPLPYYSSVMLSHVIDHIDKIDPYTIRFVLKHPYQPFLYLLAQPSSSILSLEYALQLVKNKKAYLINRKPIGTGPYKLHRSLTAQFIKFTKNENYWNKSHYYIKNLTYIVVPNASMRLQKLINGECDAISLLNMQDIASLKKKKDFALVQDDAENTAYLAYNTHIPPFGDVRVRRALALVIDKEAIRRNVYGRQGKVAHHLMPQKAVNEIAPLASSVSSHLAQQLARNASGSSAFSAQVRREEYTLRVLEAKRLLTAAGHPNGLRTEILVTSAQRPYNSHALRMAQMIQADWKEIGVHATITRLDWTAFLTHIHRHQFDVALSGWNATNIDPDSWLPPLLGCDDHRSTTSNISGWCSPHFDSLMKTARATFNPLERRDIYRKMQEMVTKEQPDTPLIHARVTYAIHRNVVNFSPGPYGLVSLKDVYISASTPSS